MKNMRRLFQTFNHERQQEGRTREDIKADGKAAILWTEPTSKTIIKIPEVNGRGNLRNLKIFIRSIDSEK
uniref:Uncharacterized protein n=1 Tax=Nelumbo nucifera TaxID=4432 RepID=A0A822YZB0_NELNU|nr:TPA_asm: hypothetical protein HUJ06_006726 [Nelumbo nucifera]